jgi:outer membrane protein
LTQFSQPLSQQYKIGLNIKLAKVAKLVDEQKLRAQKQSVTSQVKQAYYAILRTQSALASSEENLKFDRELDRTTEQYVTECKPFFVNPISSGLEQPEWSPLSY